MRWNSCRRRKGLGGTDDRSLSSVNCRRPKTDHKRRWSVLPCTCWCALRSNWMRQSDCGRRRSRWIIWICTGCGLRIQRVRDAGVAVRVASPRVLKPGEEKIVDFLLGCDCPILVRSTGLLEALRHREARELTGDFSLNAANVLTADEFFKLGLHHLTPTYDLNAAQVADLRAASRRRTDRGRRLPASARVSHRALRLLPVSLHRAPAIAIADGPAKSTAWRCAIRPDGRIP